MRLKPRCSTLSISDSSLVFHVLLLTFVGIYSIKSTSIISLLLEFLTMLLETCVLCYYFRSFVDQHSDIACTLQRSSCGRPGSVVHIWILSHYLAEVRGGLRNVGLYIPRHVQYGADQNGGAIARRVQLDPRTAATPIAVPHSAAAADRERERRGTRSI